VKLAYDSDALRDFCRQRGIARLELFGSSLRDDFGQCSDLDSLCTLRNDTRCTLLGWADLQFKLSDIFGRNVDLVSRKGIERSKNAYRKKEILTTARTIYVEA
jgi:predicted nucleotidyltransferase